MKPLLHIEDIHKDFEKDSQIIHALRGISLQVSPGESMSITGPSGAGKSTLLNIMGTLEPPSQGTVFFEDKNVYEMDEAGINGIRNRGIGFVFQFHHLLYEFNALENAMVPALISGYSKRESEEMASDMLSQMGLRDRLFHRVGELSGGEQQRVAISRALIMGPKLLLADEPTGNLDKATGDEITELLMELNKNKGLALVIATHNLELARQMSKQLLLVDGRFV
ncbi:MAG: lipoprotein-releasing system ATP-binding protein LolD [Deltaproteobacteria bacterium]|nr:ABC transporter ATP-binding protein [Deltaproteobacteria bacterium]MBW2312460.1 ABC transporter ATP-binding protein [Deltaproteobacteria bacterium]RLB27650.1 MAG: lipoprotein-releasing system ATP-binding protein LolD [Deltaproteobacteria bacterium]